MMMSIRDRGAYAIHFETHSRGLEPQRHDRHDQDPEAARIIIPDTSHAANLHQPIYFNRALETFLDGLPA